MTRLKATLLQLFKALQMFLALFVNMADFDIINLAAIHCCIRQKQLQTYYMYQFSLMCLGFYLFENAYNYNSNSYITKCLQRHRPTLQIWQHHNYAMRELERMCRSTKHLNNYLICSWLLHLFQIRQKQKSRKFFPSNFNVLRSTFTCAARIIRNEVYTKVTICTVKLSFVEI